MQKTLQSSNQLIQKVRMLILLFGFILLLTSCEKILFTNEGHAVEKTISYAYFSKLSFYDIFEIELKTDSLYSVRLISTEKFIDNISIREDSGELSFHDENFARWMPEYPRPKLLVSMPRLDDKIYSLSPIKLTTSDTLKLEKLSLVFLGKTGEFNLIIDVNRFQLVNGSDNFDYYTFTGKAKSAYIWPRGSSQVDASGLICKDCIVYNNSMGDCYVNVTHKLEARMNALGNVFYSGQPEEIVITEESGSGKLLPFRIIR
jgi:hypothetical protein